MNRSLVEERIPFMDQTAEEDMVVGGNLFFSLPIISDFFTANFSIIK